MEKRLASANKGKSWRRRSSWRTRKWHGFWMPTRPAPLNCRSCRSADGWWTQSSIRFIERRSFWKRWPASKSKKAIYGVTSGSFELWCRIVLNTLPSRTNRSSCAWSWTRSWSRTGELMCTTTFHFPDLPTRGKKKRQPISICVTRVIARREAVIGHQILPDGHGIPAMTRAKLDSLPEWLAGRRRRRMIFRANTAQPYAKPGDHLVGRFCGLAFSFLRKAFGVGVAVRDRQLFRRPGDHLVGRFCRRSPSPGSWRAHPNAGRLQVGAGRFPAHTSFLLNAS